MVNAEEADATNASIFIIIWVEPVLNGQREWSAFIIPFRKALVDSLWKKLIRLSAITHVKQCLTARNSVNYYTSYPFFSELVKQCLTVGSFYYHNSIHTSLFSNLISCSHTGQLESVFSKSHSPVSWHLGQIAVTFKGFTFRGLRITQSGFLFRSLFRLPKDRAG